MPNQLLSTDFEIPMDEQSLVMMGPLIVCMVGVYV